MRIFALETDIKRLKKQFLADGEQEVLFTHYHGLAFLFSSLREIFLSFVFIALEITAFLLGWPMFWITVGLLVAWFVFAFLNLLKALIDWLYDFILVTGDRLVLMDQTSIFHQKVNPIHLENVGSVAAETQFWGILPLGKIVINLKEGEGGQSIVLKYVPNAQDVAATISKVVTHYQRYVDGSGGQTQ